MKKVRLDQLVYELGFTDSRERAKTTVMSGLVFVNGQRADKPGMPVAPDAKIEVHGDALPFVDYMRTIPYQHHRRVSSSQIQVLVNIGNRGSLHKG